MIRLNEKKTRIFGAKPKSLFSSKAYRKLNHGFIRFDILFTRATRRGLESGIESYSEGRRTHTSLRGNCWDIWDITVNADRIAAAAPTSSQRWVGY